MERRVELPAPLLELLRRKLLLHGPLGIVEEVHKGGHFGALRREGGGAGEALRARLRVRRGHLPRGRPGLARTAAASTAAATAAAAAALGSLHTGTVQEGEEAVALRRLQELQPPRPDALQRRLVMYRQL